MFVTTLLNTQLIDTDSALIGTVGKIEAEFYNCLSIYYSINTPYMYCIGH